MDVDLVSFSTIFEHSGPAHCAQVARRSSLIRQQLWFEYQDGAEYRNTEGDLLPAWIRQSFQAFSPAVGWFRIESTIYSIKAGSYGPSTI